MALITPKAILQADLVLAEYARSIFRVTVPAGLTTDDITVPSFWAHVSRMLKPGTIIEVMEAGQAWFAILLVRKVEASAAYCTVLEEYDLAGTALPAEPHGFVVKHRGPRKWSVLRELDKAIMIEDLDTEAEAEEWIAKRVTPVANLG